MEWNNWQQIRKAYPLTARIVGPAPNLDIKPGDSFAYARSLPAGVEVLLWAEEPQLLPKHCCEVSQSPFGSDRNMPAKTATASPHVSNRNAWEGVLSPSSPSPSDRQRSTAEQSKE